jgi:hypothetical protein
VLISRREAHAPTLRADRRRDLTSLVPMRDVGVAADTGPALGVGVVTATALVEHGYSITWSARTKGDWGIVSPSALAVLRFMTNSNFVGQPAARDWRPTRFPLDRPRSE